MLLRTYLDANTITDAAFAASIGASKGAVRKWKAGKRTPRPEQMLRIRAATAGAVSADDFLPAQPIAVCVHCGKAIAEAQSCGRSECPVETQARAA